MVCTYFLDTHNYPFWTDYIIGDAIPSPINSADILLKYGNSTQAKEIEATDRIISDCKTLHQIRDAISELEGKENELMENIKMYMQDAEYLVSNGQSIASWKSPKKTRKFDAKAFCKDNPVEAEHYMIEQQGSRRFILNKIIN